MEIQAENFIIKMTHDELWATAFDVRNSLYRTIETHWINFQNNWMKEEASRLGRLKSMFSHLGRLDLYNDILDFAEGKFREFNKSEDE